MKTTIGFGQFIKRCIPGLIATVGAPILFVICLGVVYGCVRIENAAIKDRNAPILARWEAEKAEVYTYNLVASTLNGAESPAPCIKPQTLECYVQMISALVREQDILKRTEAYFRYKGFQEFPDDTTILATYRAINDNNLLPVQRFNLMAKSESGWSPVNRIVESWLAGTPLVEKPIPPQPKLEELYIIIWYPWKIFAWVLVGVVMVVMAVGYRYMFEEERDQGGDYPSYWAIPTHLGSWLIMLIYAPSFLSPWIFRLIRYLVVNIWLTLKWIFAGMDMSVPIGRIKVWQQARRQNRLRLKVDEEVRIAESNQVGSDVVASRLDIERLTIEARSLPDGGAREELLAKLAGAAALLEQVAEQRSKRQDRAGSLGERVTAVCVQIESMQAVEQEKVL